jgi:DNA-binding SARP family transcriptional activator/TolB-like protein
VSECGQASEKQGSQVTVEAVKDAASGVARGAPPLSLKLLGETKFRRESRDVTPSSKRAQALVAYLALARDNSAPRARLASLFWGDRGEEQARASLRQCVYEARTAIGDADPPFLATDRSTVSLGGDWTSDVREIEALLRSDSPDDIARALELAGEEVLLNGHDIGEEFEEWLVLARANFERRLAEGARRGLSLAIERGAGEASRRIADQYLLREPGDEELTVLAMRADAARGATPLAHRRFQKLRDWLASELGATPGKAALDALASLKSPVVVGDLSALDLPRVDSGPPLLVVPPFEDAGLGEALGHLAGGLHGEVVAGLSRFRDLRVLVEQRAPSADERGLYGEGVSAYALAVTLRAVSRGVRVTPVLTRVADRSVIWSDRIFAGVDDLQQAIDSIVDRIIGAIAPRLETDAVPKRKTGAIYDAYLTARHLSYSATSHEQAKAAAEQLEGIIAAAPELAVAYPPLIRLYNTDYGYTRAGATTPALRDRAFELAKTALSLDRGHVHSYTVMGWAYLWRRNPAAARSHFEEALRLNPFHAQRIKEVAGGMLILGDPDRAEVLLERCLELSPLPDDEFLTALGLLCLLKGEPEKATDYFDLIAHSGVWNDLYVACNRALAGRPDAEAGQRLRKRVQAIWGDGRHMTDEALLAWIEFHHPFCNDAHRNLFLSGVSQALGIGGAARSTSLAGLSG